MDALPDTSRERLVSPILADGVQGLEDLTCRAHVAQFNARLDFADPSELDLDDLDDRVLLGQINGVAALGPTSTSRLARPGTPSAPTSFTPSSRSSKPSGVIRRWHAGLGTKINSILPDGSRTASRPATTCG